MRTPLLRTVLTVALVVGGSLLPSPTALGHPSGCHSAHSCPSNHHTYVGCDRTGHGCSTEKTWGRVAYFDSVSPPRPTGCTPAAAKVMADDFILPYAKKHYPSYYVDITGQAKWFVRRPVCKDLTLDGNREMIVRLVCCTGGAASPWAIFKHDASGQWQMAYVQIHETVFRLGLRGRTVRAMVPAPYEGACTRYVRYREVRWTGSRFRSRLTRRSKVHVTGC